MKKLIPFIVLMLISIGISAQEDLSNQYATEAWGFITAKNYTKAYELFDKSITANPNNIGAFIGRGFTLIELNRHVEALSDFNKAQLIDPKNPYPPLMIGWSLLLQQKYSEAKPVIFDLYRNKPYFHNSSGNLGNYYFLTGNDDLARNHYLESLAIIDNADLFNTFCGDFDKFIEKGWRVEAAKKMKTSLQSDIDANRDKYMEAMQMEMSGFTNYDSKNYNDAAASHRKAIDFALTFTPSNYHLASRNCYYLADAYNMQNNKDAAFNAYLKGSGYVKKGNVVTSNAASICLYAGYGFKDRKKYTEAIEQYQLALDIYKKLENDADIASVHSSMGEAYNYMGNNSKAIEYLEKAIALDTKINDLSGLAIASNNLGAVYKDMGDFVKAAECFDKAISLGEANNLDGLAIFYSMKGNLLLSMADYQQALELFTKAYMIDEKADNRIKMGQRLNSIGQCYYNLHQVDQSIEAYNKSIALSQAEGDTEMLGLTYNSMGASYYKKKNVDLAEEYYNKALAINRRTDNKYAIAGTLNNLAEVYTVDKYDPQKAMEYLKEAETYFRQLNLKSELAEVLNSLGGLGIAIASSNNNTSQLNSSVAWFKESIAIKEELRKNLKGGQRVKYLESVIFTYELLTAAYIYMYNYPEAFNTIETSRAKSLTEKIAAKTDVQPVTLAQVQADLTEKQAILYYANTVQNPMSMIVITKSTVEGYQIKKDYLIDLITPLYGEQITDLVNNQRGFKKVGPPTESGAMPLNNEQLKKKNALEDIVNFCRSLLIDPSNADKQQIANKLASELYRFLISPAASQLSGKTELTIVADGILAYLPFETLKDNNNLYMVETANIRYLHSLTVESLIKKRVYPETRNQLLALGGATYEPLSDNTPLLKSPDELYGLQKSVNQTIAQNGSLRSAYASLGITQWQYLPGTLTEVNNIKTLIPSAKLMIANECGEKNIKAMSKANTLANYKILHFATHGLVVPEIPALSALVLNLVKTPSDNEDGYLTMNEIENLKLKADFVNLSACETGLGKIYGGEGVVGLSQSFLIAGANGLSVSLWQVADESTSQFMVALYKDLAVQNSKYHQCITDIKRRFIKGEFGDIYKAPYYWAPFVYFGK